MMPQVHALSTEPDSASPGGTEIRYLIKSSLGDLTHATCLAGQVALVHRLPELYEAYYVLAGHGEIWRRTDDREGITALRPGRWVEMPPGTEFQFRAGPDTALVFLVVVMPSWQPDLFHVVAGGPWVAETQQILPPTPYDEIVDGWMAGDLHAGSDDIAPDGSEIRLLFSAATGSLVHCTLNAGTTSAPVRHQTVYEIWYVEEGHGEFWTQSPDGGENVVLLRPGLSVDIPTGTAFQFRSTGIGPLRLVLLTMPSWPGPQEAVSVTPGHWT